MSFRKSFTMAMLLIVGATFAACSKSADKAVSGTPAAAAGHSHEGWWCDEHGVPEEVCAQCDPKLVAGFKAKSDWCEKHNRPDSQCFVCHPEKEAEFAAVYEAKTGEKPPKPAAEADEHEAKAEAKQS